MWRPGLLGAVGALRRGDVLMVAKRDRLGRDVLNVALVQRLVERKGARVVSAAGEGSEGSDDDGPGAQMFRGMVDLFAQYERAVISQRTKAALVVKKQRGERVGGIPFGYQLGDDGRTLLPQPDEQRALHILRELQAAGCGPTVIAAELNQRQCRTRAGGLWTKQRVYQLTAAA